MIYTSFAVLAAGLLISLAFIPLDSTDETDPSESLRIGQASFFLDSVLDDMERSLSMATRRAFTETTNWVVTEGEELKQPKENLSSALVNGTISGDQLENMEDISLNEWTTRVSGIAEESNYRLEAEVVEYSFEPDVLRLESSFSVEASLDDPVTLASFNRSNTANSSSSMEGVEDTMILLRSAGRYVSTYSRCSFDEPVEQVSTGTVSSAGTAYGDAVVNPDSEDIGDIQTPSEKILVVDDVDEYDVSDVNSFEGVASESENSTGGYSTKYVFGTGSLSSLLDSRPVLLEEDEVWRMDFSTMFQQRCYVPSETGPDPLERLGNEMVAEEEGVATLLEVPALPAELQQTDSAVAHVYFNDTDDYGDIREIEGVSDEHPWFRLDQSHIDRWNADAIVK